MLRILLSQMLLIEAVQCRHKKYLRNGYPLPNRITPCGLLTFPDYAHDDTPSLYGVERSVGDVIFALGQMAMSGLCKSDVGEDNTLVRSSREPPLGFAVIEAGFEISCPPSADERQLEITRAEGLSRSTPALYKD